MERNGGKSRHPFPFARKEILVQLTKPLKQESFRIIIYLFPFLKQREYFPPDRIVPSCCFRTRFSFLLLSLNVSNKDPRLIWIRCFAFETLTLNVATVKVRFFFSFSFYTYLFAKLLNICDKIIQLRSTVGKWNSIEIRFNWIRLISILTRKMPVSRQPSPKDVKLAIRYLSSTR